MKSISVKSIIVLSAICLVVALLLSSINLITEPMIKEAEEKAANEAFLEVLPNASELETVKLGDDVPKSVLEMRKDKGGSGYAFKLKLTNTYAGKDMTLIVGIGPDGKIIKMSFVEYTDTKGSAADFDTAFKGKDNTADGISGATVTSSSIKDALNDAYSVLEKYSTVEQSDEQKLAPLCEALMPAAKNSANGSVKFSKVDISQYVGLNPAVTVVYAPSNEIGYVVLVKDNENSFAVAVNAFGKAYKVSDLEGNEVHNESAVAAAESMPPIYLEKQKVNERRITSAFKNKFGEENISALSFEAIRLDAASTVTAAYKVKNGEAEYLAFIAQATGYHGTVKVLYVVDADGNIVIYKTTSQSESAGYGDKIASEDYANGITGNIETLGDEAVLVSGATVTSEAVKLAKNDIKAAYLVVKEGQADE